MNTHYQKGLAPLLLILIIAVVVIGGGAGVYVAMRGGDGVQEFQERTNDREDGDFSGPSSLRSLLSRGQDMKCTFSVSDDNIDSTGTSYISGGKMRSDFASTVKKPVAATVRGSMIVDGEYSYSWAADTKQGAKIKMASMDAAQSQMSNQQSSSLDLDQNMNYDCDDWDADADVFSPPADIDFMEMDFSKMMQAMPSVSGNGSAAGSVNSDAGNACAICDSLPDATAKSQCKASLNCQ